MSAAWVAAIVAIGTVFSPLLLSWLTGRQRRAEKKQDWKRQDEVAEQAAKAAALLLAQNKVVAAAAGIINEKLDTIHTLVNSQMTAALQSESDAITRELAMMKEVIALKRASGQEPSQGALEAIVATEAKIAELRAVLADRNVSQAEIETKKTDQEED